MSTYVCIAYRWGQANNHQYALYAGEDETKALAMAENECNGRGGKYGVAVYEATNGGESFDLRGYYPSGEETEPTISMHLEMIEALGHVLLDYAEGSMHVRDPERPGYMKIIKVEPIELLVNIVRERKELAEKARVAHLKAREEARERRERIWCPVCDTAPVYAVEYVQPVWRIERDETSGEIEVEGLEGNWCKRCENMHVSPDQITRNQFKIWNARHKAKTGALE